MILLLCSEVKESEPISPECWESMDESDRARAFRIASVADRKRFVTSRFLLRQALSSVLGENSSAFAFLQNADGKPLLLNGPDLAGVQGRLDFSISHSGEAVAVAVSTEGRVGVDIERFQKLNPDSISVAFSQNELETLRNLPEKDRENACLAAWSAKEAVAKLLGCPSGLDTDSLIRIQSDGVTDSTSYRLKSWTLDFGSENYQLCLAHEGSAEAEILLQRRNQLGH